MKLPTRRKLSWKERVLCLWFPSHCLCCGKLIAPKKLICAHCRLSLPNEAQVRQFSRPGTFFVYAPFSYRGGFRRTLHAFKFEGEKALGKPIGLMMAAALPQPLRFDLVTFIPMTPQKQADRGYNQSELLARAVAEKRGFLCLPLLKKVRSTATQHDLTREERLTNPVGAYQADARVKGRTVLLVDDIVTTGSTLCECAAELYRMGAKSVVGLCAANTESMSCPHK